VAHVVSACSCPLHPADPEAGSEDLILFLGPDQRGTPLEVVAVELADGDLLVIHAMRMRAAYADDYERVMRCRPE
jgi:hypothetical protein